jgi:hypothetical protein
MGVPAWYHVSAPERQAVILADGLQPGKEGGYTDAGAWADDYYGVRPVYIARVPWELAEGYRELDGRDFITFTVEVEELQLLPDLPSLIDEGFVLDPDSNSLWAEGTFPGLDAFAFTEEAYGITVTELSLEELLTNEALAAALVALTGTAACISAIPAARLALLAA